MCHSVGWFLSLLLEERGCRTTKYLSDGWERDGGLEPLVISVHHELRSAEEMAEWRPQVVVFRPVSFFKELKA